MKKVTLEEFKQLAEEMWQKVINESDLEKACKIRDVEMKKLIEEYKIIDA